MNPIILQLLGLIVFAYLALGYFHYRKKVSSLLEEEENRKAREARLKALKEKELEEDLKYEWQVVAVELYDYIELGRRWKGTRGLLKCKNTGTVKTLYVQDFDITQDIFQDLVESGYRG